MNSPVPPSLQVGVKQSRIPVVAFFIEALSVGGAEHMLVLMANEFVQRGWQVHMICLTTAGKLADNLDDSVQLQVLNKRRGIDAGLPWRIGRCIDQIKPDVINSHLWVANAWTRLSLLARTVPIVVTEHSRDSWKSGLYRWIDRQLSRKTYRLVAVSNDTADFYQNSVGVDKQRICVINNGVDTARFAAGCGKTLRREWLAQKRLATDDPRTPILVGTVGRLVAAKNHRRLIDAAALLIRDADLACHFVIDVLIVGEGPERVPLQKAIDDHGLTDRIHLSGMRHDIPDVLAALDVFVLSSDREGHPLTALEAQAAGTPVVLTDAGGSADAIAMHGDRSGGVLVSRDVAALSDAVRQMILHPQLREEHARFARTHALENFDKRQMIDKYESVFRSAFRLPVTL